ncbi:MAG: hypothetical protein ACYDAQ_10375 [Mycobacteriales bacterium]
MRRAAAALAAMWLTAVGLVLLAGLRTPAVGAAAASAVAAAFRATVSVHGPPAGVLGFTSLSARAAPLLLLVPFVVVLRRAPRPRRIPAAATAAGMALVAAVAGRPTLPGAHGPLHVTTSLVAAPWWATLVTLLALTPVRRVAAQVLAATLGTGVVVASVLLAAGELPYHPREGVGLLADLPGLAVAGLGVGGGAPARVVVHGLVSGLQVHGTDLSQLVARHLWWLATVLPPMAFAVALAGLRRTVRQLPLVLGALLGLSWYGAFTVRVRELPGTPLDGGRVVSAWLGLPAGPLLAVLLGWAAAALLGAGLLRVTRAPRRAGRAPGRAGRAVVG